MFHGDRSHGVEWWFAGTVSARAGISADADYSRGAGSMQSMRSDFASVTIRILVWHLITAAPARSVRKRSWLAVAYRLQSVACTKLQ